jgi:hypothetical protein
VSQADQPGVHLVGRESQVFGVEFLARPPVADTHIDEYAPAGEGVPMGNCLLESFLGHFRNLVDFFSTPPVKDDCSAQHFVSPEEWVGLRERFSDSPRTARDRMNKRLAHLTYSRGDQENYPNAWPISDMAVEIIDVMTAFLDMAEARLDDEWSSQETRKKLMDLEVMAVVVSDLVGST